MSSACNVHTWSLLLHSLTQDQFILFYDTILYVFTEKYLTRIIWQENHIFQACLNEKLQGKVDQLTESVDQANLQISLKDEALKVLQHSTDEKCKEFESMISSLKLEHEDKLESVNKKLGDEIENLKKDAQLEIHEMTIKHQEELSNLISFF